MSILPEANETMVRAAQPARVGIRLRAFLLDYALFLGYALVLFGAAVLFSSPLLPLFSGSATTAQATGFAVLTLPVTLYFAIAESSVWQGTWGKRRLGLQVVDRAGKRLGFGRSFLRSAVKFLPWELGHYAVWQFRSPAGETESQATVALIVVYGLLAVYIALPLVTASRRSLYDYVAGTQVTVGRPDVSEI